MNIVETRTDNILQAINKSPGISYSQILRETKFSNGVLSHHLSKIEKSGRIQIHRMPRVTRIYPTGIQEQEIKLIKNIRNPTKRIIIELLLEKELSFKEIVKNSNKSQGTISNYLSKMIDDNIIKKVVYDNKLVYEIRDVIFVKQIILTHADSFLEKIVDNFSDMINSL